MLAPYIVGGLCAHHEHPANTVSKTRYGTDRKREIPVSGERLRAPKRKRQIGPAKCFSAPVYPIEQRSQQRSDFRQDVLEGQADGLAFGRKRLAPPIVEEPDPTVGAPNECNGRGGARDHFAEDGALLGKHLFNRSRRFHCGESGPTVVGRSGASPVFR